MSDKICPLLTMMSMNKENEDHIIFDYEEPCMGEKCAWYNKCFPEPVYTYSYPDPSAPVHIIVDGMPQQPIQLVSDDYANLPGYPNGGYFDTAGRWIQTGGL